VSFVDATIQHRRRKREAELVAQRLSEYEARAAALVEVKKIVIEEDKSLAALRKLQLYE
jgi:hypothetical protein